MGLRHILAVLLVALAACSPSSDTATEEPLPPGDASRGGTLFNESIGGAPSCTTCHLLDGTVRVGPSLQGYAAVAATRVAGLSAEAYTRESIRRPAAFIVSGFPNAMYNQYAQRLSPQQMADLIAYLLTL